MTFENANLHVLSPDSVDEAIKSGEPMLERLMKALPCEHQLLFMLVMAKALYGDLQFDRGSSAMRTHYERAYAFLNGVLRGKGHKMQEMKRIVKMVNDDESMCNRASIDPAFNGKDKISSYMPVFAVLSNACKAVRNDPEAVSEAWSAFINTLAANSYILNQMRNGQMEELTAQTGDDDLENRCWHEFTAFERSCPKSQSVFHHLGTILCVLHENAYPGLDAQTFRDKLDANELPRHSFKPLPERLIRDVERMGEGMSEILPGVTAIMTHLISQSQGFNVMMD